VTPAGIRVTQTASGVRLDVRVIPRASRSTLDGVREGRLVLRVTAPPVDSAANEAVVRLLADALQVPKSAIAIVGGATGRSKTVELRGQAAAAISSTLERLLSDVKR